MALSQKLVLYRYLLGLLGFEGTEHLIAVMGGVREGFEGGLSGFANTIVQRQELKVAKDVILKYDHAIMGYESKLRESHGPKFQLKYFQYVSILLTEILLDGIFNHPEKFRAELNEFVREQNLANPGEGETSKFGDSDLKKIAYWMATGSGKTEIMHVNYWQYLKYEANALDNIILITPNEGLSRQHYNKMTDAGIPCRLYAPNRLESHLIKHEVLIMDIYKLTGEKKGKGGVQVEVSAFEGRNLVFIDEGHKGQATDEQTWKKLREELGRLGFIFEYSAVFEQVIRDDPDLLDEYSKAIIFDYRYRYFYDDGYGKDFFVYNLSKSSYQSKFRNRVLTANLLSFYEQMTLFESNKDSLEKEYMIERPLWTFVGSTVSGGGLNADVLTIVKFLNNLFSDKTSLRKDAELILAGRSGMTDPSGKDIFKGRFTSLKGKNLGADEILSKVFHSSSGGLELCQLLRAEGEIGLRCGGGEYFGVINIGGMDDFKRLLDKAGIKLKQDRISESLFLGIEDRDSTVNLLIGAKKFTEGWDSWRVCSMGLLNIGKGEGPQIIQLFGRGVRLKGRNLSLKREVSAQFPVRALQTLNVFGWDADYMERFLSEVREEVEELVELPMETKPLHAKRWKDLFVLENKDFDFRRTPIPLGVDDEVLTEILIDIRPTIMRAHGLEVEEAELTSETISLSSLPLDLIDWTKIYMEILDFRDAKGFCNLRIDRGILRQVISSKGYKVLAGPSQVKVGKYEDLESLEQLVLLVLKKYVERFYTSRLRREETKNLKPAHLSKDDDNLIKQYVLRISKDKKEEIEEIKGILKKKRQLEGEDMDEIPTLHFDRHLYTPLVIRGKEYVRSSPPKLNESETTFVAKLKDYVKTNRAKTEEEVFLLRNLSRKGLSFFETSGFYPDFILWRARKNKQIISFIDPKGILYLGNLNDEKIQLHKRIKELEKEIGDKRIKLESYILSITEYDRVKQPYGGISIEEFERNHVLFLKDDPEVIDKLFAQNTAA
jgi:hypothetical protein